MISRVLPATAARIVRYSMKPAIVLAILLATTTAVADERFLLPVTGSGIPGAYGSIWSTELALKNQGSKVIRVSPELSCQTLCLGFTPIASTDGVFRTLLYDRIPQPPGGVLVVDDPEGLFMNLRVRDESRTASSMGVEIPIIPEAGFSTLPLTLLNIPGNPRFRQTLRIYTMAMRPSPFRVRLFDEHRNPIGEQTVTLTVGDELLYKPSGSQIDLRPFVPQLDQRYYAVIEPLEPVAFWTFISVTNNDTQEVTIITP